MSRLTDNKMTAAERKAFSQLVQAVGFAPKVMFGRDTGADGSHILGRVANGATNVLYAIAVNGLPAKNDVHEYRLLVVPVQNSTPNSVRTFGNKTRRLIAERVSKSWELRRQKYGPTGKRYQRKPVETETK